MQMSVVKLSAFLRNNASMKEGIHENCFVSTALQNLDL